MFSYSAFGLTLASVLELPELLPGAPPFDVVIAWGTVPERLDAPTGCGAQYELTSEQFLLKVPATARYLVSNGDSVVVERAPGVADASLRVFLLGPVFGALLHQRGALPIHGSAIVTPRGAVIFAGSSGHGKSTLAWEFHRRGYAHLCDDVSTIGLDDGVPVVYPAYPQLNLWADVLEKRGHTPTELNPLRPRVQKYALPTRSAFHPSPVPLYALYALQPTDTDAIEITSLCGLDKLHVLTAHTYAPRVLAAMGTQTAHFQLATSVGQEVRVRRIARPSASFRLQELADCIEKDLYA